MKVYLKHSAVKILCGIMVFGSAAFGWEITLDDAPLKASDRAWIADSGQVMVALDDLVPEMIDAHAFDFDGWQITIVAGEYGITGMVTSPVLKRDGFASTFQQAPIVKDEVLWFPIEALAALMNYPMEKDVRSKKLAIQAATNEADSEEIDDVIRRRMTSVANNSVYVRPTIAHFEDLLIPGSQGLVSARLYDPSPGDSTPSAVYINIHGGGWKVGSISSSDHVCRDIANQAGQKVISIEYNMLPEYPYPAGWDDAYAMVFWVSEHHRQLKIDPARIIVGGDSAGGNIANAVAMMARDRGEFRVTGLVLAYPVVDMTTPWAEFVFANPEDAKHPYATPKNGTLAGMPPTLLLVAENDGLRPQGEEYAALLGNAQVRVEFDVVVGTSHGFLATHAESRARIGRFIQSTR
ncbi:MAG: alpha/beta hydrolase [Verrucomicrobia bacterium]|nr:alpha/beta hydrolase [Verrucomicrobiota bacterium]MDA1068639.1 alpha/beta hydrolase [Verrucomicrobiota bacterium]